jgi:phosphoribosylglycinamide formyltransferase 1
MDIVVLISGGGSNLQALIDKQQAGLLPVRIAAVISNRADAFGLQRAAQVGVPTQVLSHQNFADRDHYDRALIDLIDQYQPKLVVLAGFMRILTATLTNHYAGRLLNIHPSLLPKHRGLHTHRRALQEGDTEHGCSVHFVTHELDGGPLIVQAKVPVLSGDNEATLAARVLEQEHRIYPLAIRWFAEDRLVQQGSIATLDGIPLHTPVLFCG